MREQVQNSTFSVHALVRKGSREGTMKHMRGMSERRRA
jgi:hypothetical protein